MKASKEILIALSLIAAFVVGYFQGFWWGALVFALGLFLIYREATIKFVSEVKVELDKCSWPWDPNLTGFKKYKELIESTVVVIISVVLLAGYVTTWDFLLSHGVGALTGTAVSTTLSVPVPPAH
jgi:preprotein translocase subunit SecE